MIPLLLMLAAPQANDPQPDDIVVVANRGACKVRFADKDMTDAAFDARSAEWKAGRPVRVVARAEADLPCIRKIASRLFAKGVTRIEFVDPQGKPAFPFEPDRNLPRYTAAPGAPAVAATGGGGAWSENRAREHSFVARNASQLILQGRCEEARKMALEQGDLDAAADVVAVCRADGK